MKLSFSLFAFLFITAYANTEKAIFVAPASEPLPDSIHSLNLEQLTPEASSLRKSLPVTFPSNSVSAGPNRQGEQSWYLLANLNPQQRYELRVCWAAIQPTNFWIDVFEANEIIKDQQLLDHVTRFSLGRTDTPTQQATKNKSQSGLLFLRLVAAADFFTTNKTSMRHPPPVDVDIILDPYLANIFPRSLLPTAGYIIILAICSWYISGAVWTLLGRPGGETKEKSHAD